MGRSWIITVAIIQLLLASVSAQSPVPTTIPTGYPSWWFSRAVIPAVNTANVNPQWPGDYAVPNDYGAVNQGQLKQIATAAFDELQANCPGGAGPEVTAMIKKWHTLQLINGQTASPDDPNSDFLLVNGQRVPLATAQTDDYAPVNLGQLKAAVLPFYNRLITIDYAQGYPWAGGVANDYLAANIGQIKNLFSFDLVSVDQAHDADGNGIPDWWEKYFFGKTGVNGNDPAPAGNSTTIKQAWQQGTNPVTGGRVAQNGANTGGDGSHNQTGTGNGTQPNLTADTQKSPFLISYSGWVSGGSSEPAWDDENGFGHYEDKITHVIPGQAYRQHVHYEFQPSGKGPPKVIEDEPPQPVDPDEAFGDPDPPYIVITTTYANQRDADGDFVVGYSIETTTISDGSGTPSSSTADYYETEDEYLDATNNPAKARYEPGDTTAWVRLTEDPPSFEIEHVWVAESPSNWTTPIKMTNHLLPWLGEGPAGAYDTLDISAHGNPIGSYSRGSVTISWDTSGEWEGSLNDDDKKSWLARYYVLIVDTMTPNDPDYEADSTASGTTYSVQALSDIIGNPIQMQCASEEGFTKTKTLTVLPLQIDGDNDGDGTIDADDRKARDDHPTIVQEKLNKQDSGTKLIIRRTSPPTLPLKLVKSGDFSVTVTSTKDGSVLLGKDDSESSDISQAVNQDDLEILVEGMQNGRGYLALQLGDTGVDCDKMPTRVLNTDIIFRNGSNTLAMIIGLNVTHGGIDTQNTSGSGSVVNLAQHGIVTISVDDFYSSKNAADGTRRRVTFKQDNYMWGRICEKLFDNATQGQWDAPSGAKPWNVFSSSDNYATSNCLEWIHMQWKRAVQDVFSDLTDAEQISAFQRAYFRGGPTTDLVAPDSLSIGPMDTTALYLSIKELEIGAGFVGRDADPNIYSFTFEGTYRFLPPSNLFGNDDQRCEADINTIDARSYFNSSFFTEVPY